MQDGTAEHMDLLTEDEIETYPLIQRDPNHIDSKGNYTDNTLPKRSKEENQIQHILNSLLPPNPIPSHSDLFQQVSQNTPVREDVISLQRTWDELLQNRQARQTGICPIREQLNAEAFDEIIRQMTINMAERGLLAVRIRDESKMTIDTYQTLYRSSVAFGMRKCVQAQRGLEAITKKTDALKQKRDELKKKAERTRIELENRQLWHSEAEKIEAKKQSDEIEFYKHKKQCLETYLQTESNQ